MVEEVNNDSDNLKGKPEYVNKLTVKESDIRIKTANNNIVKVNGKTVALKLNIEGHECDIEFLVIDHGDSDGLLGLDWIIGL
ncbi:hypothetical protein BpHYR1_028591 [Brachionus plicatilis]|uniref:Uncharacterized protein n=1 Tax=Brachionus plicatilis TaxID=10195 RepID=A0A3M7R5N2_BRAPC|nr:hypothetical protein BpHYR1_028591 [Brachionus plicatilis]